MQVIPSNINSLQISQSLSPPASHRLDLPPMCDQYPSLPLTSTLNLKGMPGKLNKYGKADKKCKQKYRLDIGSRTYWPGIYEPGPDTFWPGYIGGATAEHPEVTGSSCCALKSALCGTLLQLPSTLCGHDK